jgi:dUTP pyrophosphatase
MLGRVTTPTVDVRITRLTDGSRLPAYQTAGAAGFDLAASQAMTVAPGEVALVPTGLVIEVPAGYFLGVFARSSTPLKRGLMVANGVGIVDSDYCGPADEVKIEVFNFTAAVVRIDVGDRLAQGVILPYARAAFREADAQGPSRGGFGSTGA